MKLFNKPVKSNLHTVFRCPGLLLPYITLEGKFTREDIRAAKYAYRMSLGGGFPLATGLLDQNHSLGTFLGLLQNPNFNPNLDFDKLWRTVGHNELLLTTLSLDFLWSDKILKQMVNAAQWVRSYDSIKVWDESKVGYKALACYPHWTLENCDALIPVWHTYLEEALRENRNLPDGFVDFLAVKVGFRNLSKF